MIERRSSFRQHRDEHPRRDENRRRVYVPNRPSHPRAEPSSLPVYRPVGSRLGDGRRRHRSDWAAIEPSTRWKTDAEDDDVILVRIEPRHEAPPDHARGDDNRDGDDEDGENKRRRCEKEPQEKPLAEAVAKARAVADELAKLEPSDDGKHRSEEAVNDDYMSASFVTELDKKKGDRRRRKPPTKVAKPCAPPPAPAASSMAQSYYYSPYYAMHYYPQPYAAYDPRYAAHYAQTVAPPDSPPPGVGGDDQPSSGAPVPAASPD